MSEIKKKIAVFVSGSGSNLQAIIDSIEAGKLNCEIAFVIADRPCYALERAEKHNIRSVMLDRKLFGEKLSDEIDMILSDAGEISCIVLAGYLSIISENFVKKWSRKIINMHPSLLPKFGGKGMYGLKVHQAVFENGDKESGCTVHYVTSDVDAGEIIGQDKVDISMAKSPEEIQKIVLEREWKLLPSVVKKLIK
mgnify:CR=1 FL=1